MLWTIAVVLFVLWALGLATAYTAGGFIHVLLVVALAVVLIQFISGRRIVPRANSSPHEDPMNPKNRTETDPDEALSDAAQGQNINADDVEEDGASEIDAIGRAAGLKPGSKKPFTGIEEVDRRDQHRWELDPASAKNDPAAQP